MRVVRCQLSRKRFAKTEIKQNDMHEKKFIFSSSVSRPNCITSDTVSVHIKNPIWIKYVKTIVTFCVFVLACLFWFVFSLVEMHIFGPDVECNKIHITF